MANYIHLATSKYPVSETQIRAENPQTSYPAGFPCPEGYAVVFPAPAPAHDPITQFVREIAPVLTVKGTYEQAYEVIDLPAEQAAANQAAATRSTILGQIAALEATVTQRRMREAVRGSGKAWLDSVDDQIAALRAQLP